MAKKKNKNLIRPLKNPELIEKGEKKSIKQINDEGPIGKKETEKWTEIVKKENHPPKIKQEIEKMKGQMEKGANAPNKDKTHNKQKDKLEIEKDID